MQIAQKALAEAQDPKRLESYRDAVTKAETNLATLRTEQTNNKIAADELASSIGVTSTAVDVLRQSATDTATPLDDISTEFATANSTLSKPLGLKDSLGATSTFMGGLAGNTVSATSALGGFNTALGKVTSVKDKISGWTELAAAVSDIGNQADNFKSTSFGGVTTLKDAVNALDTTKSDKMANVLSKFAEAYRGATDNAVKNLIDTIAALNSSPGSTLSSATRAALEFSTRDMFTIGQDGKTLTDSEYATLTSGKTAAEIEYIRLIIRNLLGSGLGYSVGGAVPRQSVSSQGMQGVSSGVGPIGGNVTQNITINLNYATPPSSNDPLGDVKRYIAAQGGRLRI
jgi:hypothetical protein